MKALRRFWRRLAGSLAGSRREGELAREIESHIQMMVDDRVRRGLSPAQALRAARLEFGGVESTKEQYRDQRGLPSIDSIRQDVTFAWRSWRRTPGATAIAVLSLAVGIGANTTVFGLLNGVLLKPLPVRDAHQLRLMTWVGSELPFEMSGRVDNTPAGEMRADAFSAAAYQQFRDHAPDFTNVVAVSTLSRLSVLAGGDAFVANGMLVSGNLFAGLGVPARLGRALALGDDQPGAIPAAVISHQCWRGPFALDPGAVGRVVLLNGSPYTIVGVLPEGFGGVFGNTATDVYVPLSAQPQLRPRTPWDSPDVWTLQIIARLRAGADVHRAESVAAALFGGTLPPASSLEGGSRTAHRIVLEDGSRGFQYSIRRSLTSLFVLAGTAGIVLLVACANIAGLQLVRGMARRREIAVRMAIGAGRWRLVRHALTESLLLSLAGAAIGFLLASWGTTLLSRLFWPAETALDLDIDHRVFGFTLALSIIAAMLSGLGPAIHTTRAMPVADLAARTAPAAPRLRVGRSLVSLQVGLSFVLLVGAGLFSRTLINLYRVDTGFNPASVLVFSIDASTAGYRDKQAVDIYERVLAGVERLGGVRAAAHSNFVLLSGWMNSTIARVPGRPAGLEPIRILRMDVSDRFFGTMGLPVLRGRAFSTSDDEGTAKVVIVNETLARTAFPGEDPIGRVLTTTDGEQHIVGVVRDMAYHSLKVRPEPTVFSAYRQRPRNVGRVHFEVRTAADPMALLPAVRTVVAGIDRRIPVADAKTQALQLGESLGPERGLTSLASGLALVAVLLSCIGLYGVMAYQVACRRSEIGIRMALGSTAWRIVGPMLRGAVLVIVAGVALGLPAVIAAGRVLREHLFEIEPTDPATVTMAVVLLLGAAVSGAVVPARRAARIDPAATLRCE